MTPPTYRFYLKTSHATPIKISFNESSTSQLTFFLFFLKSTSGKHTPPAGDNVGPECRVMVPYRADLVAAKSSPESASSQQIADSSPHSRSPRPPRRLLALPPAPLGAGVSNGFVNGPRGAKGSAIARAFELPVEVFPIVFQVRMRRL